MWHAPSFREGSLATGALLLTGSLLYAWHVLVPDTGWIAFISTAPWVLVLIRCRQWSYRRMLLAFGLAFYALALVSTPWLRSFTALGWVLAPLFYLPFFVLAPLLVHHLLRTYSKAPLLVLWPLSFTAAEWLRIRMSAGELPLLQLGTGLISTPLLAQIADVTGVAGLTALACMTAALAAAFVTVLSRADRGKREWRALGYQAAAVLGTLLLVAGYGALREGQADFRPGPAVLVVQHNFHGWLDPADADRQQADLVRLTEAGMAGRDVDIVVWPENSVMSVDPTDPRIGGIVTLARRLGAAIVVDGPTRSAGSVVHHTTALVEGDSISSRYDKVALVPWSEYLPGVPALRRVSPRAAEAFRGLVRSANPHLLEMTRGSRIHALDFAGPDGRRYAVATPICYESLSPRLMTAFFRAPARRYAGAFVLNPVSERLLGNAIHEQTLALTRLRAIENRVTIIRASNNGISAAVDPSGRPYAWVRNRSGGYAVDQAGFFVADVILDSRFGTVYARYGDWLPKLFLICLTAFAVAGGFLRRRRQPSPPAGAASRTADPA